MIFVLNQLNTPDEDRVSEYISRCFEKHYEKKGEEQKLKDLGLQPGQAVIGADDFRPDDLKRMMDKLARE